MEDPFGWHTSIAMSHPESAISSASGFEHTPTQPTLKTKRYAKLAVIGKGGMGEVWMGWDNTIKRNVAIKIPLGNAEDQASQRLMREVLLMAKLEHPGIVAVFDVYHEHQQPRFVMSLIRGQTFAQHIEASTDPLQLIRYIVQTCDAVGHAHQFGIVHRDITPRNLIVTQDNNIKVIDWGLAIDINTTTPHQGIVGTPGYMAPEQAQGRMTSPRSDVWSLGTILHQILHHTQTEDPTLLAICEKATHQTPKQRYPNAEALGQDIQRWMDGRRVEAYDTTFFRQAKRLLTYYKRPIIALLAAFALISSTLLWGIITSNREAARANQEAKRAKHANTQAQKAKQRAEQARDTAQHTLAVLHKKGAKQALHEGNYLDAQREIQAALKLSKDPEALGLWASIKRPLQPTRTYQGQLGVCDGIRTITNIPYVWTCHKNASISVWQKDTKLWSQELHQPIFSVFPKGNTLHIVEGPRYMLSFDLLTGKTIDDDSRIGEFANANSATRRGLNRQWLYPYQKPKINLSQYCVRAETTYLIDNDLVITCDKKNILVQPNRPSKTITIVKSGALQHLAKVNGVYWSINDEGVLTNNESPLIHNTGGTVRHMSHIKGTRFLLIHNTKGLARLFDTIQQDWVLTFSNDAKQARVLNNRHVALLLNHGKVQHFTTPQVTPIWRYRQLSFGFANVGWNMDNTQLGAADGSGYVHLFYPQTGRVLPPKRLSTRVAKWVDVDPKTNQLYASAADTTDIVALGEYKGLLHFGESIAHTQDINGPLGARRFGILSNGYVPAVGSGYTLLIYKNTHPQELTPRHIIYDYIKEFTDGRMGAVYDLAISPNHDYAILAAKQGVYLWYPPDAPYLVRLNKPFDFAITLANEGRHASINNKHLSIYDDAQRLIKQWPLPHRAVDVAWRPGHDQVVTGHANGELIVWDINGQIVLRATPHSHRIGSIDVSHDGKFLASAGWDGYVYILDLTVLDAGVDIKKQ